MTTGLQVHAKDCTDDKITVQVSEMTQGSKEESAGAVDSSVVTFEGSELSDSDETVHHKIDKVVLKNFQSWTENSGEMEFERDVLNRVHARNETGKSVMFKVFKQMCFPGKGANQARIDLIRRNCTSAEAEIYISDGNIVRFILTRPNLDKETTFQFYELIDSEGKKTRFEDRYLPEPIRRVLGWYVDPSQKILLNLIEKDGPQLFINTTSSFNAEALKFITENPRITEAVSTVNEWMKECKDSRARLQRLRDYLEGRLAGMEYIDIAYLEVQNAQLEEILPPWSKADTAELKLEACLTVFKSKPKKPDIDFVLATEVACITESAVRVSDGVDKGAALLKTKPIEFKCDMETATQCKNILEVVEGLSKRFTSVDALRAQRPDCIDIADPKRCAELSGLIQQVDMVLTAEEKARALINKRPKLDYSADQLRKAQEIARSIRSLKSVIAGFKKCVALKQSSPKMPVSVSQLKWLHDAAVVTEKLDKCWKASATCYKVLHSRHKADQGIAEASRRLEDITRQLPECPICGSPMNGGRAG